MARPRRRDPPAPGAVRSIGQMVVVVAGGTGIGGLLVLLAFPDATPFGPAVLLAGAAVLAAYTGWLARRLGRAPERNRTASKRRSPAKRTTKKAGSKKRPAKKRAAKKASAKQRAAKKRPAKKRPAKKRPAKKRASQTKAQGRGRR